MFELVHRPRPLGLGAAGGRGTLGVHGLRLLSKTFEAASRKTRRTAGRAASDCRAGTLLLSQHLYRCETSLTLVAERGASRAYQACGKAGDPGPDRPLRCSTSTSGCRRKRQRRAQPTRRRPSYHGPPSPSSLPGSLMSPSTRRSCSSSRTCGRKSICLSLLLGPRSPAKERRWRK